MIIERFNIWSVLFDNYNLLVWMVVYNRKTIKKENRICSETVNYIRNLKDTYEDMKRFGNPHTSLEYSIMENLSRIHTNKGLENDK